MMVFKNHFQKMIKIIFASGLLLMMLALAGRPAPAAAQTTTAFERRDHPVHLIAAYYNAIALKDYARAYSYWDEGHVPGGASYLQFAQGFADVHDVHVLARLPVTGGVAAGTAHAEVPVNVLTNRTDGTLQVYAGCFHVVQHNVPVGEAGVIDPGWYLSSASLQPVVAVDFALAADACSRTESFPAAFPIDNRATPPDLLTSYYDAIARHDYIRAYGYWPNGKPGQSLAEFIRGFANTDNIGVVLALSFDVEIVPGTIYNSYVSLPFLLTATDAGQPQLFVGCIRARKSIDTTGSTTSVYDPSWVMDSARINAVGSMDVAVQLVWNACPA